MHNIDLILTLTSGLAAALTLGYIAQRIGLSPMVGYLVAGVAVGPHTPGYVANQAFAEQLAEIGIILLMFGVGLHFHIKELLSVRRVAIPGAIGQSIIATVLGALLARAFGWDWSAGLVFGLAISVASTVVLLRVLADHRDLHTLTGHIAVGWLVVEDLFTVLVLVLLPAMFGPHAAATGAGVAFSLLLAAVKIGVLAVFTLVVGGKLIPWLLDRVVATRSRELFTLTILVIALGIAVGAAKLFGVSMALGAFLAGMVVGRSDFSFRAASEAMPMRDAFAVLFFVSVGMLFDPRHLIQSPLLVATTLAVVMLGKPLAAIVIVLWLGYPLRVALGVAIALAQIGEFSFILANLGTELRILTPAATNTLVAVAIVSISVNPLLYGLIQFLENALSNSPRLKGWLPSVDNQALAIHNPESLSQAEASSRHRAVIVGYGPVGQIVCRLLRENEIEPTVIEMNIETVRKLKEQGISAIYGDATHRDILQAAGVSEAAGFILSSAQMENSEDTIRLVRELNPEIRILARAAFVRELPALRLAGAEAIFSGEGEVALAFTEEVLRELGATPEQIDRERERVRSELGEQPAP